MHVLDLFKTHEKDKKMIPTEAVFLLLFLSSRAKNAVVILKPDNFLENELLSLPCLSQN